MAMAAVNARRRMSGGAATRDVVFPMARRLRHRRNRDQESGATFPVNSLVKFVLTIIESNQALGARSLT